MSDVIARVCRHCGSRIFQRDPGGQWDLVMREQDNTLLCFGPAGSPGLTFGNHEPKTVRADHLRQGMHIVADDTDGNVVEQVVTHVYRTYGGHVGIVTDRVTIPEFDPARPLGPTKSMVREAAAADEFDVPAEPASVASQAAPSHRVGFGTVYRDR